MIFHWISTIRKSPNCSAWATIRTGRTFIRQRSDYIIPVSSSLSTRKNSLNAPLSLTSFPPSISVGLTTWSRRREATRWVCFWVFRISVNWHVTTEKKNPRSSRTRWGIFSADRWSVKPQKRFQSASARCFSNVSPYPSTVRTYPPPSTHS